jgi:hypothetical protein
MGKIHSSRREESRTGLPHVFARGSRSKFSSKSGRLAKGFAIFRAILDFGT